MSPESNSLSRSHGYKTVIKWLRQTTKKPFDFQTEAWQFYAEGYCGMVNAPTGFGKTFSMFLAAVIEELNIIHDAKTRKTKPPKKRTDAGLKLLWITPLRSLAKDLARAMREVCAELELDWIIGVRNGDTSQNDKLKQKKQMPEVLIITPESMHLLLAQKGTISNFNSLRCIVADEWHELIGSKRGVLAELAISRIRGLLQEKHPERLLRIWGISATIGNMEEALDVLVPYEEVLKVIVKADLEKKIDIRSVLPDHIDMLPWAGHLGHKLAHKLLPLFIKVKPR